MNKFLTKKNVFFTALIMSMAFLLSAFQKELGLCGPIYNDCWDKVDLIWPPLSLSLPLFLLSLITYKMKEQVFNSWIKFTIWFVPLTIFLTFITPDSSGSFGLPAFGKGLVAFLLTALFTIISILIILVRSFTSRKK